VDAVITACEWDALPIPATGITPNTIRESQKMPIVKWSEEFNVNVKIIDDQHQQMLDIVNSLHSAVEASADKAILEKLLIELYEHTRVHFSTEDELMKKHNFPGYADHLHEHHVLLQHLDNLVKGVTGGEHPTFRSDYDVSSDWVLIHIFKSDMELGAFLNTQGIY
jgi:hemerythrin-like metal-binding protein